MPKKGDKRNQNLQELCKICSKPVKLKKNGIKCQGACGSAVHYSCIQYTPGKIKDIQRGYVKVSCPCPTCSLSTNKNELYEEYQYNDNQCSPNKVIPSCGKVTMCIANEITQPNPTRCEPSGVLKLCGEKACYMHGKQLSPEEIQEILPKVYEGNANMNNYAEPHYPKSPASENCTKQTSSVQTMPIPYNINYLEQARRECSQMSPIQVRIPLNQGQMPPIQTEWFHKGATTYCQAQVEAEQSQMPPLQVKFSEMKGQMSPMQTDGLFSQGQMPPIQTQIPPIQAQRPQFAIISTAIQTLNPSVPPHAAALPHIKRLDRPHKITPEMMEDMCSKVGSLADQLRSFMTNLQYQQEHPQIKGLGPCPGKECGGQNLCPARVNLNQDNKENPKKDPKTVCEASQCRNKTHHDGMCPGLNKVHIVHDCCEIPGADRKEQYVQYQTEMKPNRTDRHQNLVQQKRPIHDCAVLRKNIQNRHGFCQTRPVCCDLPCYCPENLHQDVAI